MKAEDEQAFREFVTSQMASLRKLAYMTCGDWHAAEDAVANALVKLYPRWRKLERPDLYVKTMVYRAAIDETRRPWRRERSAGDAMPDAAVRDTAGVIRYSTPGPPSEDNVAPWRWVGSIKVC